MGLIQQANSRLDLVMNTLSLRLDRTFVLQVIAILNPVIVML
jgi:hypothetical protein